MSKAFHASAGAMVLSFGLIISGCSKPHDPPHFDEPGSSSVSSFDGLLDHIAPGQPLQVFWVHGMCPHKADWADNRLAILRQALPDVAEPLPAEPPADPTDAYVVDRTIDDGDRRIDLSFFIWSPLIDPHRRALDYDSAPSQGGNDMHHASINTRIKSGLMNDCLVDAVVYSGPSGDPVRIATRRAVCEALGGRYSEPADCDAAAGAPTKPLVFVSESLGSKLLFDAVSAIADNPGASAASRSAFDAQLARTRMVFMVANQIPLLDQAGSTVAVSNEALAFEDEAVERPSLPRFLDTINRARGRAAQGFDAAVESVLGPPPTVVAFSDPNDLLSYRLEPEFAGGGNNRLVNVVVSNAYTYFGLLENPLTAHCNYRVNPYVLGLIIDGYEPDGTLPTADVGDEETCL